MRLLIAEDHASLAKTIARGLSEEGFAVDVVSNGEDALHQGTEIPYDCIVLDRMMPRLDGLEVLRRLRARAVRTPVLLLTALGEIHDRVAGLDAGADDYLVKPFAFSELVARVRALLRRSYGRTTNALELGPLRIDLGARSVSVAGRPVELTAREFDLLEALALKPNVNWSRTELVEHLYREDTDRDSNVIDVFVARLRKKLEQAGLPEGLIRTQRGAGYRLDPLALGTGAPS